MRWMNPESIIHSEVSQKEKNKYRILTHIYAKSETRVLWPPHEKSWLIGKDSDAGRDWGQEEKGMTEDEMAGRHHWLDGHWVWVNSGSWWWTGRPGVLWFMGWQRVGQDWETELNWLSVHRYTHISFQKSRFLYTTAHSFLFEYLNYSVSNWVLTFFPLNNYFFLIAPQLIKCQIQFFQLLSQKTL